MKERDIDKKHCLFYLENFPFFDEIKFKYINSKLKEELNIEDLTKEVRIKLVKMINIDFRFNFINYDYYFEKDKNKRNDLNNLILGYFSFYKTLNEREKKFIDFSSLRHFLIRIRNKIEMLGKVREEIEEDKKYYSQKDKSIKLKEIINNKIDI